MDDKRTCRGRRPVLGLLLLLLGVVGAVSIAEPSMANVAAARKALETRVLNVRSALHRSGDDAAFEERQKINEIFAQWLNWPNWNNWANWPNWPNWVNWFNR